MASRELARQSPVMAELVARHGPMRVGRAPRIEARFEHLARMIAYQQLAGKAAETIWARVRTAVGDDFTPKAVLAAPDATLTGAGLSRAKAASLVDLADHVDDGRLRLGVLGRMSDDAVIAELVQVRGIGPWTAHMFLMGTLQRLDVWPTGDYGVRTGFARAWELDALPEPKELERLGEQFRPYRSVVAWYCWRAADDPDYRT
jgi:DNA-3-methyladenine glycosylase II